MKDTNNSMCDVGGDIRLRRNFIIHHKAIADERVKKLKVLTRVSEGPLVLISEDMTRIQEAINTMNIYLRDENKKNT